MKMSEIDRDIRRLKELPVRLLKAEFEELWGEPARSNNKTFLIKRIAWRRQAAERGSLSERARERALSIAEDVEMRVRPPAEIHKAYDTIEAAEPVQPVEAPSSVPAVGTTLVRQYRGRRIEVHVRERGFEWEGQAFRSLTAIAEAVTGSKWNGPLFFGLSKRRAAK